MPKRDITLAFAWVGSLMVSLLLMVFVNPWFGILFLTVLLSILFLPRETLLILSSGGVSLISGSTEEE